MKISQGKSTTATQEYGQTGQAQNQGSQTPSQSQSSVAPKHYHPYFASEEQQGFTPLQQQHAATLSTRELQPEESDALMLHNDARAAKGIRPLQWDAKLAADAEAHAKVLTTKRKMEHTDGDNGENLFQGHGCSFWLPDAVQAWLDEEVYYSGQKIPQGDFASYGHYTQCMWSSTTHVGMGRADTSDGMCFIVAHYAPVGNQAGETPY